MGSLAGRIVAAVLVATFVWLAAPTADALPLGRQLSKLVAKRNTRHHHRRTFRRVVFPFRFPGRVILPDPQGEIGRIPKQLPGEGIRHPQRLPGGVPAHRIDLPHPPGVGDQPLNLPGQGIHVPIILQ